LVPARRKDGAGIRLDTTDCVVKPVSVHFPARWEHVRRRCCRWACRWFCAS
jgi:hypothetical protein